MMPSAVNTPALARLHFDEAGFYQRIALQHERNLASFAIENRIVGVAFLLVSGASSCGCISPYRRP
jgi:hypothetical protein